MELKAIIEVALKKAVEAHDLPEECASLLVELERPSTPEHGDWSTSLALKGAKLAKQKPRDFAGFLIPHILAEAGTKLSRAEIAGPGFINLFLSADSFLSDLQEVLRRGGDYGRLDLGVGKCALVEFVSANPTGPLHVGHGRGAVVGDVMAAILSFAGYAVDREYYVNDGGVQMNLLGSSIAHRHLELKGENRPFPENGYRGDYIRDIARDFDLDPRYATMSFEERVVEMGKAGCDRILREILADLQELGISFNHIFYESSLYREGRVEAVLSLLKERGYVYEADGALWLKTTAFGDDKDRVLRKKEGAYTYFAPDIAYHADKQKRGYHLFVNVWGADHGGYVPRMKAAFEALGMDRNSLHVLLIQMVHLLSGGEKVNMSTRAGEFEELSKVRIEAGRDATRYFFLMRSYQAQLDFDLDLAKKRSAENPVYYIQYAHARIASIFRKVGETRETVKEKASRLNPSSQALGFLPEEIALLKKILEFPEIIALSARELEPHRPAFYLLELAKLFQHYYTRGREDKRYQILETEGETRVLKLALLAAVGETIQSGLTLLGISAPEEM